MKVEVVYALGHEQRIAVLDLPGGATAADAVKASGLAKPGLKLGMHGRRIAPGRALAEGDRVELLRPLAEDPKEARRRRARRR